jgi:hypothetical protein
MRTTPGGSEMAIREHSRGASGAPVEMIAHVLLAVFA